MTSSSRIFIFLLIGFLSLSPSVVQAATLDFSPIHTNASVGTTFTETIFVSSTNQAINAISGTISFPPELLQVISVSKANSLLSLWVQDPTFSNADGTISFSGIVPNPGFIGSPGRVFSIQFRAKKSGTAAIVFSASSQVLANDGNGTDILDDTNAASITLTASTQTPVSPSAPTTASTDLLARITSSSHPDETHWYALPHAVFDWTNAQGVSAIRLGYDTTAGGKPTVLYSDPISHKELDLTDGIWYFYVQEKDSSGWGPISTYRVQTDTIAPLPFGVTFLNGTTTTKVGSTIAIQFTTRDELSGIDQYHVVIDGKETTVGAEEGSKPYAITGDIGTHTLLVRAYDKAGNVTTTVEEKFSIVGEEVEKVSLFSFGWLALNYLSFVLVALAILGTLLFGAWYIKTHFSAYRRRLNHQLGITEAHIHKKFDTLKDAITDEVLKLEKVKSARELTREEEVLIARFKKLLEQSEQEIEKEIEEIPR